MDVPIKVPQLFEEGGVHLTLTLGRLFMNMMLFNTDAFFTTDFVNQRTNINFKKIF